MSRFEAEAIPYFNPQKEGWNPEDAEIEAQHLDEDAVIVSAITGETYGSGSLAEIGFLTLNAIRLDDRRDFVVYIEPNLQAHLKENHIAAEESRRSRILVGQHLKKLRLANLYVVDSLEQMLTLSVALYRNAEQRAAIQHLNPHHKLARAVKK